jgi:NMD protein affecting ribosome stability and mRNA decay
MSDYEATRKTQQGMYLDLCNHCFKEVKDMFKGGVDERQDLHHATDEDTSEDDTIIYNSDLDLTEGICYPSI